MLFNGEFPGGGSRQSECQSVMLVKFRIYWFVERCKLPLFRVVPGDDREWITDSIYDILLDSKVAWEPRVFVKEDSILSLHSPLRLILHQCFLNSSRVYLYRPSH